MLNYYDTTVYEKPIEQRNLPNRYTNDMSNNTASKFVNEEQDLTPLPELEEVEFLLSCIEADLTI